MNKHMIFVVGIGPGKEEMMSREALQALDACDVIVGYSTYLELLGARFDGKEKRSTPMKQEIKRCRMCFEEAKKGKRVAIICSGDVGVYGMAAPMLALLAEYPDCDITVVPGITAAISGAAVLGAPINHDFCVISLSDLLTPWEMIEKRIVAAAQGDFAIVLYNPSSKKRHDYLQKACDILLANGCSQDRVCGVVENIGRKDTRHECLTLKELREKQVNMFTTVFIGNSQSEIIEGRLVTKRGYLL